MNEIFENNFILCAFQFLKYYTASVAREGQGGDTALQSPLPRL